jgi:hypothetical protein
MEKKKNASENGGEKQGKLDGAFTKVEGPQQFTRESILQAVSKFVVCDDQVK